MPENNDYADHYERLLAQHYTWMFGVPFDEKAAEQAALLAGLGVKSPGIAVDLGCGSGFQSIALAELGAARIHAVDTSAALLRELQSHAAGRPIMTHEADLMDFDRLLTDQPDTIVCMGDTLTHLPSREAVAALFGKIFGALPAGGQLVLSWRDLSQPPQRLGRFIALRSSEERIMTCFLEDQGETVLVHDLVHVRSGAGWTLEKSAYPKLKLSADWVRTTLQASGFGQFQEHMVRGMSVLAARR